MSSKRRIAFPVELIVSTALALVLASLWGSPIHAATPVSGEVNAVANAGANGTKVTQLKNTSWSGTPQTLSTSVQAFNNGVDSVLAEGQLAEALWTSADSGSVDFVFYGWSYSVADSGPVSANLVTGRGGDDWSYTFVATEDGEFVMNYAVQLDQGDGFGLNGWGVSFTGVGSGFPVFGGSDPTQSGTFIGQLLAGQTYTVGLSNRANVTTGGPQTDPGSFMDGRFDWTIVPVPEPSTWAMLALGFAAVAVVGLRRPTRRKV
jgi:hypothetical protein